jgi:NAD-dependent DNA ligase
MSGLKFKNIQEIIEYLEKADSAYFHGEQPLLTDQQYDVLKEFTQENLPNHPYFKLIDGEIMKNRQKVKLPYAMYSLDKIKYNQFNELNNWLKNYPGEVVISPKLDGKACLVYYKNDGSILLASRSREMVQGYDLSFFLRHLNIPPWKPEFKGLAVRGELIIPLKKWKPSMGKNPRAVVNGIFNRLEVKDDIRQTSFVAYDILSERMPISEVFKTLKNYGFTTPRSYLYTTDEITVELLKEILFCEKEDQIYELDGLVVVSNHEYQLEDNNPSYAFAFKDETPKLIGDVDHIEWNVQATGKITPVIILKNSVQIAGAEIKRLTGHNAKLIVDGGLGKGAVILLTRCNEVTPGYVATIKPVEPDMPDTEYYWNENHTQIYIHNEMNDQYHIKEIVKFTNTMKFDNVGEKTLETLYNERIVMSINDLINLTKDDLIDDIPSFGNKKKDNLIKCVKSLRNKTFLDFMIASNKFKEGFGERRLKPLLEAFPTIQYDEKYIPSEDEISHLYGFDRKTAESFIEGLSQFNEWLESDDSLSWIRHLSPFEEVKVKNTRLENKKVLFTGFRDEKLKNKVIENGGKIVSSYSGSTSIVVWSGKRSSKVDKAIDDGKEVYTKEQFINQYQLEHS